MISITRIFEVCCQVAGVPFEIRGKRAKCPFHAQHGKAFGISENYNSWHCFSGACPFPSGGYMDVPVALGLARDRREAALFLSERGLIPNNDDPTTWAMPKTRRETEHDETHRDLERLQLEADACAEDGGEVVSIIDRYRVMRSRPDLYTAPKWAYIRKDLDRNVPEFDRSLILANKGLNDMVCDMISLRLEQERHQHLLP